MLSALPTLAAACLAALAPPAPPPAVQDAGSPAVRAVLDGSFADWADDRPVEALRRLAGHVRERVGELGALPPAEASLLADELEVALTWYSLVADDVRNPLLQRELLDGIDVEPRHGALSARLAWLRGRALGELHPLLAWRFAGPFDNERGQGMLAALPAESDPTAESYEGKVRDVSWRRLPEILPEDGVVRFQRLLDPSEQSSVVARTWVESEEAREVLLVLGASEELRAWADGVPLLEALSEHAFAPDAHCAVVPLRAGWTELAVEVGSHDGAPVLCARLAERDTLAPLALPSRADPPEGVEPLPLADPGARIAEPRSVTRPGAWRRYAGDSGAEAAFRRALLEREAQAVPRHERPGWRDAEEACRLAPGNARYDLLRIATLREHGAQRIEEDINVWLSAVDAALEVHGELPLLLRWRARHATENQPTHERALRLLDRTLELQPASVPARVARARVLDSMSQDALADRAWGELAADPALLDWPGLAFLVAQRLPFADPQRGPLIEAARDAGDGDAIDLAGEERALASGDTSAEGALEILAEHLEHHPWALTARRRVAQRLVALGHPEHALVVLDDALQLAPEHANLHRWRARALLALGDTEGAVSALEDELRYAYGADDERRLLEHLRSLAGTPFHEPFREPLDDVLARRAGDDVVAPEVAPREVLLQRIVVRVNPDGTAKRYRRTVERVLSEAGARELDRRSFRAWPSEEEVRLLAASVRRSDGTVDAAKTGRSGERGYLHVDLPPLEVGDVVDLEWRRDDLRTTFFGNYFGLDAPLVPDPRLPVRESEVVLIVPDSFPLYLHARCFEGGEYAREEREDGTTVHTWRMLDREPRRIEALMPPAIEDAPVVQAASYPSWEAFGAWWWNLIEDEIRVSPEMAATVAELTAAAPTPLERLRAIYDFVVTEVRYNAWEFGVHGYQPYSAPVIFSRRFGDCKDKAILLKAMLSEVDIEAWPVLIRAEGRRFEEDHTLALVGHFNHCIAWIPEQQGIPEMFLDGTARLHPLEVLPDSDRGARVLVVRGDGVEPKRVPFPAPEENLARHVITVDLTGEGATVDYARTARGRFDPRERHRYTGSAEEREEEAQRMLTSLFGALRGPLEASFPDLEDLGAPVELRFRTDVEQVSRPTERGFELPTTFDELHLLRSVASETGRETDLLLDVPWSRETEIEYVLGDGEVARRLPPPVAIETEDARYERTVEPTTTGVRVKETFALRSHRVPAGRYAGFRELCRQVDAAQRGTIEVEVGR